MEGLIQFPAKFIYIHKVENHQEVKSKILPIIESDLVENKEKYFNDFGTWDCKVYTSFFDADKGMDILNMVPEIQNAIWTALDKMLEKVQLNSYPKQSHISLFWWNYYSKGHSQEVHQHCGTDFSGIYILKSTDKNKTAFYSAENHRLLNKTILTDEVEEGSIILFPSHLPHYVNPIEDEQGRITVAFNITCEI